MSNTFFFTALFCIILFNGYFILFGYFSYKKDEDRARRVGNVFLVQGVLIFILYGYLMVTAILQPSSIGTASNKSSKGSSVEVSTTGVTGLTGSIGNGESMGYEYPSEPLIEAMLVKGDALLRENKIEEAITQFKLGLNEEGYKDIFEKRIEHARDLKHQYGIYQRAVKYYDKGDYETAYSELKEIKPSDYPFYVDVELKMETIASGALLNPGQAEGATPQDPAQPAQGVQTATPNAQNAAVRANP